MNKCGECYYYDPIDEDFGWCSFSFSHPMPLKKINQDCDLEDYLDIPNFYGAWDSE